MSNSILRSQDPRGRQQEAKTSAAVKPGQCVKVTGTAVTHDVREQTVAPGFAGESAVVVEADGGLMGGNAEQTIPANSGLMYYIPLPGDELRVLGLSGAVLNAGVRGNFDANGKLVAAATGEWTVQEDAGTLSADTLVLARYSGSNTATAS